jgi:type VI secretion system protein ImpK
MQFSQGPGATSPAALRGEMLRLLEAFAKDPAARSVAPDELEDARFALVAWVDESVLRSGWPGREEWLRELLQMQLYRTNRAGNEFYERLARLRPTQTAAREIFLLCLAFGFEGQYAGHDAERRALIAQQLDALRAAGRALDPVRESPVTPSAYEVEIRLGPRGRGRIGRALLVLAAGVALVWGVLWVILRLIVGDTPLPPGG